GLTLGGSGGSTIRGLSVTGFGGAALLVTSAGNVIEGNFLGLLPDGTTAAGNSGDGVLISNAANNVVGGTASAARNVISGNGDAGVDLFGGSASENLVQGNFIGLSAAGNAALGNAGPGVRLSGGASSNLIGDDGTGGGGNVISHNDQQGGITF